MKIFNKLSFNKITPVSEIRNNIDYIPKLSGVYKFYIDKEGLQYLEGVHPSQKETVITCKEVYLLYIGESDNLFDRFKWHLGITNTSKSSILHGFLSTLRLTYMANHKEITCLSEQHKLDEFLNRYVYIQYMVTEDYKSIEQQLIKENDLPLNIKKNIHDFVPINKSRRSAIRHKYLMENSDTPKADSISNKRKSSVKIEDRVLREFARKSEQKGIKNKSNFVRWFRDIEQQSAAINRLHKAWDERYSDQVKNK